MGMTRCVAAVNLPAPQDPIRVRQSFKETVFQTFNMTFIFIIRFELLHDSASIPRHSVIHLKAWNDFKLLLKVFNFSTASKNLISSHSWKVDLSNKDEDEDFGPLMKMIDAETFDLEDPAIAEHKDFLNYWENDY